MAHGRTSRLLIFVGLGLAGVIGVFVALTALPSTPTVRGEPPAEGASDRSAAADPAARPTTRRSAGRPSPPMGSGGEMLEIPSAAPSAPRGPGPLAGVPGRTNAAGGLGPASSGPEPEPIPLDPDVADVLDEVEDQALVLREAQLDVLVSGGVAPERVQEVRELLEAEAETMLTLKQDVLAGGLDERSATATYKAMRTQADEALAEIVGDDLAQAVREVEGQK